MMPIARTELALGASPHVALAVVEAAYRPASSVQQWLRNLIDAAQPGLDQGCGLLGCLFHVGHSNQLAVRETATRGEVPVGFEASIRALGHQIQPEDVRESWAHPVCVDTASATYTRVHPGQSIADDETAIGAFNRNLGIADQLAVKLLDATGAGCLLVAPVVHTCRVDPAPNDLWRRVMTHVLAGLRLRDRLSEVPEAVLEISGAVVHAEGKARSRTARDALRQAVLRASAARDGTTDPIAGIRAWRALTSGRWSLIDRFDSDGRRYLVACRNAPVVTDPRGLTERERQVLAYTALGYTNKQIAYTLGLSASTISTHLAAAQRALGAPSRERRGEARRVRSEEAPVPSPKP